MGSQDEKPPLAVFVSEEKLTLAEMATTGLTFTGQGFEPNEKISVGWDHNQNMGEDISADEKGDFTYTYTNKDSTVGKHSVEFGYRGETLSIPYEVVAATTTTTSAPATTSTSSAPATTTSSAPATTSTSSAPAATTSAPAKAKLTIDPKRISAKKFVSEKGGVRLAVSGLKPGTSVTFKVQPKFGHVTPYTLTVTANSKGVAQWSVYGTNPANPSVYVGKYAVTAKVAGGKTFTGSFRVTSGNPNAGGGNGGGSGSGGGSGGYDYGDGGSGGGWLPRTGIELTSAGAGAVLLLVGGAVVFLTRRRKG